jgi:hypothetical protein
MAREEFLEAPGTAEKIFVMTNGATDRLRAGEVGLAARILNQFVDDR